MRVTGYRLKGYDATYEKTTFDVTSVGNILQITEINSGVTFVVDADEIKPVKAKPSYRKESGGEWRAQGNTGIDEPRNERRYWGIFS